MRDLLAIDADLNRLALELAKVKRERVEHQRIWRQRFIDAFDAGMPIRKISIDAAVRFEVVQGILFRSGRTEKGRAATAERIAQAVGQRPDEQTAGESP